MPRTTEATLNFGKVEVTTYVTVETRPRVVTFINDDGEPDSYKDYQNMEEIKEKRIKEMNININMIDYSAETINAEIKRIDNAYAEYEEECHRNMFRTDDQPDSLDKLIKKYGEIDMNSDMVRNFFREFRKDSEVGSFIDYRKLDASKKQFFVYKLIDDVVEEKFIPEKKPLSKDELKDIMLADVETSKGKYANRGLAVIRDALKEKYNAKLYAYEANKKKLNSKEHAVKTCKAMKENAEKNAQKKKIKVEAEYRKAIDRLEKEEASTIKKMKGKLSAEAKTRFSKKRAQIKQEYEQKLKEVVGKLYLEDEAEKQDEKNRVYVQIDKDTNANINKINAFENKPDDEKDTAKFIDADDKTAKRQLEAFEKRTGFQPLTDEEKANINKIDGNQRTFMGVEKNDSTEFAKIKSHLRTLTDYMSKDIVDGQGVDTEEKVSFDVIQTTLEALEKEAKNYIKTRRGMFSGGEHDWENMSIDQYLQVEQGFKWSDSGSERFELAKTALKIKKSLSDKMDMLHDKVVNQNKLNKAENDINMNNDIKNAEAECKEKLEKDYKSEKESITKDYADKKNDAKVNLNKKIDLIDMFLETELKAIPKNFEEKLEEDNVRLDKENDAFKKKVSSIDAIPDEKIKQLAIKAIDQYDIKIPKNDYYQASISYGGKWFLAKILVGAMEGKKDGLIDTNDSRRYSDYYTLPEADKEEVSEKNTGKSTETVTDKQAGGPVIGG